MTFELES